MPRAAQDRPNIILINCDDLGYGDLGCYGSPVNRTPYLNQMAAEGLRFTDFYMASPVCSPSRGAMMTGCYPSRIGFDDFEGRWVLFPGQGVGLSAQEKTVASLLKEQGYATMIIGKWHCGDQPEFLPTRHGFDHYYGIPFSNDMGRQAGRRSNYPPLPLLQDEEVIEEQPDQAGLTERYVEKAVGFLRDHQNEPFFLYLAHMYVHLPIYVQPRFERESVNGRYGAAVACVDWAAGVLFRELKRLGIDENTLVVFTSDNGSRVRDEGGSNAPLRGTKGTTFDGGQRLPCIMRWPGQIAAGRECGELVSSIDLLPTFAQLAGTAAPTDRIIDGRDLGAMLVDPEAKSPRECFFYFFKGQVDAVRNDRWKLFVRRYDQDVKELYDLRADIGETTNVYDQHPDVVTELMVLVQACREDLGDTGTGTVGRNRRPIGRIENPKPLTEFDPEHPYYAAEYDLGEAG